MSAYSDGYRAGQIAAQLVPAWPATVGLGCMAVREPQKQIKPLHFCGVEVAG